MNPILESVLAAVPRVAPVLLLPFFARTFRDHSGYDNHATPSGGKWLRQHGVANYYSVGFNDHLVVADAPELQGTEFSVFWWGAHVQQNQGRIVSKRDAGGTNFDVYTDDVPSNRVAVYDGVSGRFLNIDTIGKQSGCVTVANGVIPNVYLDGAFVGAMNGAVAISADDAPVYVAGMFAGGQQWRNPLAGVGLWPGTLTPDEIAALHPWSLEQISPSLPADRRYWDVGSWVPIGGDAVAAWDMGDVANRELVDRTGNSHTGTLIGKIAPVETVVGRALRNIDGPDAISVASITLVDDVTMEALVRVQSAGGGAGGRLYYFHDASNEFYFHGAPVDGYVFALVGVTGSPWVGTHAAIGEDTWMHVVATRRQSDGLVRIYVNNTQVHASTGGTEAVTFSSNVWLLNVVDIRALDGDVKFIRLFERYMEAEEVAARYAEIASKVMHYEDMSQALPTIANLTSGIIPGTDYRIETGTWKVDEDATGKWIECVAAGIARRPQRSVHNTFEFEVEKADASDTYILFVADVIGGDGAAGQNSYMLRLLANERLGLRKNVAGGGTYLWYTAMGYIAHSTRYKICVTVSSAGVFTTYIKGGAFINWTLVDPSGGTGTNPVTDTSVTSSVHLLHDLDAGDKLYLDSQLLGPVAP